MTKTAWNKNKSIGQKIKERREQLGLTQRQLGKLLEISASRVAELEKSWKNPSAHLLNKFAKALSIQITYLLDDYGTVPTGTDENILIDRYRKLPSKEKKLAIEIIKILAPND